MKFINLFSGSSGNCAFLEEAGERILIDCGVSAKRTERALRECGIDPKTIKAIFVTHEHSDHIQGVGAFAWRNDCMVFASCGTWSTLDARCGELSDEKKFSLDSASVVGFDEMELCPFDTNHDCAEPLGFLISGANSSMGYATDIGRVDNVLRNHLLHCTFVYLEANHDVEMLKNGPYPPFLKKRILGSKGHLSNDDSASFALELAKEGNIKHLRLAHLSEHNNSPAMAFSCVKSHLEAEGLDVKKDVLLDVALKNVIGTSVNL